MNAKKIVDESVKTVLNENKGSDLTKSPDWKSSMYNKSKENESTGKVKGALSDIKPAHAAAAALAIGAGLGGVALAKKLRKAKKETAKA